ncbi:MULTISPECIES: MarR family winged helix-turn-helix transcriptional regulator [Streptomyces]|uniref:MarR family winged helix-turn-helix transcriptional regulator n=1 Tax=Streptomyces TaxID=1883 RepID=UPI0023DD3573|nr:MarR family transcriptional regulator [Streptomyces sp. FXJ1.172]WEP00946.1 MarR family transcriptional regulator [Streptomyces sp. FXJ1.172]
MAEKTQYEELVRQLGAVGSVRRELDRILPDGCSSGVVMVLTLLRRHGDIRIGRLTELLAVDMSVASRHVTHLAARGWIDRSPDPADRRSRILRLTPAGRARLAELSDCGARLLAERLNDWSDEDVRRLTWLMARLRASFDDPGAGRAPGDDPLARRTPAAQPPEDIPSPRTPAVTR